jgi:hypothetical protein
MINFQNDTSYVAKRDLQIKDERKKMGVSIILLTDRIEFVV